MDTSERYRLFARLEAAGSSPTYERLAIGVAVSPQLLKRLDELPVAKRQPNLLFASARVAGAPVEPVGAFVDFVASAWDRIAEIMTARSTQTNEAARTGTFLPVIASIDGPIALIEVGCAAGVCLYPDRYAISYDQRPPAAVASPVSIDVATAGPVAIPQRLPDVVARVGIDVQPIDAADADECAWLEALVWPEHESRLRRLRAALGVVRADPPVLLSGDLIERFGEAISLVPTDATPVVFHSAVFNYIPVGDRLEFADLVQRHREVVWLSNEAPGVIPELATRLTPPHFASSPAFFITARSGSDVIGISDPHGSWIHW